MNELNWDDDFVNIPVRHYPCFTANNKNTWRKKKYYIACHRISERASKKLAQNGAKWNDVHYEHIETVSNTKNRLKKLNENRNMDLNTLRMEIIQIMSACEVIIISLEEKKVLEGPKNEKYTFKDKTKVKCLGLRSRGTKNERLNGLLRNSLKFEEGSQNNNLEEFHIS